MVNAHPPGGGGNQKEGYIYVLQHYPEGTSTRGGSKKKHTHHTHMKHGRDLRTAVQEEEEGGGGGGGGGEHVGIDFLARPDGAGSSKKRKGPPAREHPDPPFTLRNMTGSTGRTSYELSQTLDALRYSRQKCADGGQVGRRGAAKVLGIDRNPLRGWAPDPKTFYPQGDLRRKYIPRGEIQQEGGILFFSRKTIPPGVYQINHASRPKWWWWWWGGVNPYPGGRSETVTVLTHPYTTAACTAGVVTVTADRGSSRCRCHGN